MLLTSSRVRQRVHKVHIETPSLAAYPPRPEWGSESLNAALAATAGAASRVLTFPIEDTFQDEGFSEFCGFDVFIHVEGQTRVVLKLNQEGDVVSEVDTFSATLTTFSDTGSFSFPLAQPIMFDYGEGAEIGSTATIKIVGFGGHVPGSLASDAGIIILTGTVVDFSPEGIPIVDFNGEVTFEQASLIQVRTSARPSAQL
jgi:hypothetical protein